VSITFHDMFCGAGGSTEGALRAGATPSIGMNHWQIACQSYEANHADNGARAACVDVVTQDPRRYPKADMLLASPECTHHSYARGKPKDDPSLFDPDGDQGAERSRATMWDVVRFAEAHDYRVIVCENVEAAVKWGLPKGRKLQHGAMGPLFTAWLQAMEALDYRWKLVHLNSMVCGVPQSRDRLYPVFWKKTQREPDLDIPALGWCPRCEALTWGYQRWKKPGARLGTYGVQYVYACRDCDSTVALARRPAAAVIDWELPATVIGERSRPLKPATIDRIRRGLERLRERPTYAQLPSGLVVQVGGNAHERPGQTRAWPVDEPLRAITGTSERALVMPTNHADGSQRSRRASSEPLPTIPAQNPARGSGPGELALVMGMRAHGIPRDARTGAAQTVTTDSGGVAIVANLRGYDGTVRGGTDPAGEPLTAIAASGKHHALVVTHRNHATHTIADGEPIDTINAQGFHHSLVIANYGAAGGPANKAGWARHVDDDALGTVTATDSHALFTYRDSTLRWLDEPVVTVTTIEQHALLGDVTQDEIEACTFRMLAPQELKEASGFQADYVLHGTKTDQVCQVGNAVTAPAEHELVARVMASLDER
jgi:DNA (cytosine-5)-methyltransferase 1